MNVAFLQQSIGALVDRHESLRTRFIEVDGIPRQHVEAAIEYQLTIVDLSDQPLPVAELQVKGLVQKFLDQKIHPSTGPLFEARLWRISDQEHVLVVLIDHLVSDGVSNGILVGELWTLYDQAARGQQFILPPLPIQFADYAVWHQQTHDAWMEQHANYWRKRLEGVLQLAVPSDPGLEHAKVGDAGLGDLVGSGVGVSVHFPLGSTLSSGLRDAARRERMLLPLVVLAAYAVVMAYWCRATDLLVPFVTHGRHGRPELKSVIGYVAGFLYLRIEMDRAPTFHDLLTQVQQEFSTAAEHCDFDRVPDFVPVPAQELNFNWRSSSWVQRASNVPRLPGGHIRTQPFIIRRPIWPWKFWSVFYDTPVGIGVTVNYRPDCLTANTIHQFGHHLRWVANALVHCPAEPVALKRAALNRYPPSDPFL